MLLTRTHTQNGNSAKRAGGADGNGTSGALRQTFHPLPRRAPARRPRVWPSRDDDLQLDLRPLPAREAGSAQLSTRTPPAGPRALCWDRRRPEEDIPARPRACHAEGKTPRASAGPGHGPQERRLSTARASEHPAGLPLAGRLEKPELLGAPHHHDDTRRGTPRGSAAARRPGENARGLWLSPLLSLRPPSKLTLCTKATGGRKLLA